MIVLTRAPSGVIAKSTEEVPISFPPGGPNTFVNVTFAVNSPLKPGAAVIITLRQTFNFTFLVCTSADLSAIGTVDAVFFNVGGLPGPGNTIIQGHVLISAHEIEQTAQ